MTKVLLIIAALIVVTAGILWVAAPAVLVRHYRRLSKVSVYLVGVGIAWTALGTFQAVNVIHQILQDEAVRPESALSTVRMLASESVKEQRVYLPALLAFLAAAACVELLGRNRARRVGQDVA